MPVKNCDMSSKPFTLATYYFRMYQMICEQERLISQKEALWKRHGQIQRQVDRLDADIHEFEQKLSFRRNELVRKNLNSKPRAAGI